jgi:hypothetical protein
MLLSAAAEAVHVRLWRGEGEETQVKTLLLDGGKKGEALNTPIGGVLGNGSFPADTHPLARGPRGLLLAPSWDIVS